MNKKSQMIMPLVVALIVVLAVTIPLMILEKKTGEIADSAAKQQKCLHSVKQNAYKRVKIFGSDITDKYGGTSEIECSTDYTDVPKGREKEYTARALYDCWYRYGQGELEIFDTDDNQYCVVCSRLDYENKNGFSGLSGYLMRTLIPANSAMTYYRFLYGSDVENQEIDKFENTILKDYDHLDTSEPLAVMMVLGKEAYVGKAETGAKGGLAGTVTGAALGVTGVILLPSGILAPLGIALVVGGAAGIGGVGGSVIGFMAGSDNTADWNARAFIWPYEKIGYLNCSRLEGKSTELEVIN